MAGNIVPAIATTNAMVAGLIVMQTLCVINKQFDLCKTVSSLILFLSKSNILFFRFMLEKLRIPRKGYLIQMY